MSKRSHLTPSKTEGSEAYVVSFVSLVSKRIIQINITYLVGFNFIMFIFVDNIIPTTKQAIKFRFKSR